MCISKVAATGAIACEMQNNTYRQYSTVSVSRDTYLAIPRLCIVHGISLQYQPQVCLPVAIQVGEPAVNTRSLMKINGIFCRR